MNKPKDIREMTEKQRQELFDKIRAIQEHINRAANPGEAANAMAALQRILQRYNLSEGDIKPDVSKVTQEWVDYSTAAKRFAWEEVLAWAVAAGYFCAVMRSQSQLLFVGRSTDVYISVRVFITLRQRARDLASDRLSIYNRMLKEEGIDPRILRGQHSMKSFRNSYLLGFSEAIRQRFQELIKQEETEESTALVISRKSEITEYLGREAKGTKRKHNWHDEIYSIGMSDGNKVSLEAAKEIEAALLLPEPKESE
jgi:hypothetical protein